MTRREFEIHIKSEIEGEIRAYKHIKNICRIILKDRRKAKRKKEINRIVALNTHLWKDEATNWKDVVTGPQITEAMKKDRRRNGTSQI